MNAAATVWKAGDPVQMRVIDLFQVGNLAWRLAFSGSCVVAWLALSRRTISGVAAVDRYPFVDFYLTFFSSKVEWKGNCGDPTQLMRTDTRGPHTPSGDWHYRTGSTITVGTIRMR